MIKIASVKFPFVDQPDKYKKRPVLCLTQPQGKHRLIVIAYITTKQTENLETDVFLSSADKEFDKTGLGYDSIIRLHKLTSIEAKDIEQYIGILPENIEHQTKKTLKTMLNLD